MQIKITGRHIDVTSSIKKYIEEKILKLEKNFHPVIDAQVTISVEKYRHIVEIMLKTNASIVRVSGESEDMYATIDFTIEKLTKQLRKVKEKIKDHKAREPKIDELTLDESQFDESHEPSFLLKQVEIKPMDIDEARMQLDVLGYAFLMFNRVGTNIINVMHKTKGGDYVILEPDNS